MAWGLLYMGCMNIEQNKEGIKEMKKNTKGTRLIRCDDGCLNIFRIWEKKIPDSIFTCPNCGTQYQYKKIRVN